MNPKEHGHETLADLFKEMQADYAAAKIRDEQPVGKEAFQKLLDGKAQPAVDKPAPQQNRGIER